MTERKSTHGGTRRGAGRNPGPDWDGTGEYQKRVKTSVMLDLPNHQWAKAEAIRRGCSMADIINEGIETLRVIVA